jgi:LacI family transcriptional regulator
MSMTKRKPTIRQVAAASGVSVSTVSNLLNGRIGAMTPLTRSRIEAVMTDLAYHPSHIARSLTSKRTATIGLVIDEIYTELFVSAISAMEQAAGRAGYSLIVSHRPDDADSGPLELLMQKEVEGIILLATSEYRNDDYLERLADTGIPIVLLNRPQIPGLCRVGWDNRGGARDAVRHLRRLGHTRIGHLCGPADRESTADRIAGYREALAEGGIAYRADLVGLADYTAPPERWAAATERLLGAAPAPTAILAADDSVAAMVMQTAARRGLRVPGDLAVVGIDDQRFAALLTPPLTTVHLPVVGAAERGLQLLLDRLRSPGLPAEDVTLSTSLIVRESCGASLPPGAGVAVMPD